MAQPRKKKNPTANNWRTAAARLAGLIGKAQLHARVRDWLAKNADSNEPRAVAVSGGADSVALLLLLWAHFPEARERMLVLHYDHATRRASAKDAKFVQELATALGVSFATERRKTRKGSVTEAELREMRWRFFRAKLKVADGRMVFLGHQQDDIAETMLMRLARGSGAGGLSAPRPVNAFADGVVALRPLLNLSGMELRTALKKVGVAWREDASNATDQYLRNRIRRLVLPAWRKASGERDLAAGVARARALLEEDDAALEAAALALIGKMKLNEPLTLRILAGQPRAIARRVLRHWVEAQSLGGKLSATAFETLLEALVTGQHGRWSAGRGCWLEAGASVLRVSNGVSDKAGGKKSWPMVALLASQVTPLPTGGSLQCQMAEDPARVIEDLKNGRLEAGRHACLAVTEPEPRLLVRGWKAGDRYRPLGAPGRRKLQDLFTDKKIPVGERFMLPVVCNSDGQPIWVPGLPPAESHRVRPGSRRALWLTYLAPKEIM